MPHNTAQTARNLTRRGFIGLGLAGVAGAGMATLAGCTATGTSTSSTRASLRTAWYGGDPVHAAMEKVIAHYHATHSGVKVSAEHSAFADYFDKLATETAAKDAPDVMRMSLTYFAEYAGRGALLDLSDYVKNGTIAMDGMKSGVADSGKLNGKRYGIGQSSIANAAFLNTTALETLGAKAPSQDWTWDDLATWAKGIGSRGGGKLYGTSDQSGHFELFEPFARQNGTNLFSSDGTKLKVSKDLIEHWWSYWADLRAANGAPPASITAGVTGFNNWTLVAGQTVLDFGWVQQIQFVQPLMKGTLQIIAPPGVKGGKPGLYVDSQDMWSIASTSKNPEAAATLINYLLNDNYSIKTLGATLGIPPSDHAIKLLDFAPDSPAGKAVAYVNNLGNKATTPPPPWPKGYNQVSTLFSTTAQDVAFKKTTPSAAAASFYSQAQQALAA